jgi:hypothetical protein
VVPVDDDARAAASAAAVAAFALGLLALWEASRVDEMDETR